MIIVSLAVTFETMGDDKDQNDVVTISASGGEGILDSTSTGKNAKWDNKSTVGPFGLWFKRQADTESTSFRVSKTGTDGWAFKAYVDGIDAQGNRARLIVFEEKFKDKKQTTSWSLHVQG